MPYIDREKARAYKKAWNKQFYEKNKKQEIARVTKRKMDVRKWLNEYRGTMACHRCGESDPVCLDFHHRDPKTKDFRVGDTKAMGWGKKRLLVEIQKCVVVCANCHRKLHAKSAK